MSIPAQLRIAFVLHFLLLIGNAGFSQIPFFRDQQFQRSNTDARISSLGQDSKGHLWIGTSDGLFKFDGFTYKKVQIENDSVQNAIKSLCVFSNDQVVIGKEDGNLYLINGGFAKLMHPAGYDTGFAVTDIVQSYGNEYWISTYGNGLYRIKDSVATRYSTDNGMPDDFIYSLTRDRKGRIWAATDNGIACIYKLGADFKISIFGPQNGLTDNIVKVVETGPGGEIWAGTLENGIAVLNENTGRFSVPERIGKWNYGHINCMVLLENEFWIGTDMTGILDYEFASSGRVRSFDQSVLYNRKSVDCMFVDHSGNVWIASGSTLLFTPGERIEFLNSACGNGIGNVRAILSERNGTIWASTQRGVLRFYSDSTGGTVCDMPLEQTGYGNLNVVSFHQDKSGRIWMGTFDKGLLIYHPSSGKVTSLTEKDGLVNGNVLSMTGKGATVWLGTLGGVAGCLLPTDSAKDHTPRFFSLPGRGPGTNFIYKVFEDSRNRLLTGTDGDGFGIFDGSLYSSYGEAHGLKDGVVYSITEDLNGGIWVATSESGLYRFYNKSIKHYSLASGLTDLAISAVTTDDFGNIIVVNKNSIDVIDAGTEHVITLGEQVGVKAIDPELNCVSRDGWGNTWIGTRDGIIKLRLDRKVASMIPTLHLDRVLCFLEPVDTTERQFSYNRNHISFEYSGIWYDDPEAVTFRYILEGYSTNWVETRDRFVTFPSLSPGKYTFRVMSSLNGNFKDSREISYAFRIESPFWQKTWFIGLVFLFTITVLAFYIRYRDHRTRNLESLNRERIQTQFEVLKNQVNPHFLFNSFNTLINIIDEDKEKAVDYVNTLSDFFRRILTLRDKDIIPLSEEMSLLDDYLFLQKQRYGNGFEVDNRVSGGDVAEKISVPTLALQMLVENAFKHNAVNVRKPLRIEIFVNESGHIVVRNNKVGRLVQEPSTGTGLQNLAKRYKLLTGQEPVVHDNFDSFTVILPAIRS